MKDYIVGVDLGRDTDPTAIVVAHIVQTPVKTVRVENSATIVYAEAAISRTLAAVYAEQIPLRTPYDRIAARIKQITTSPHIAMRNDLLLDATGVGTPVVDILRANGVRATGVRITAGTQETVKGQDITVPKVQLVDSVIALLHTQRLSLAAGLPHMDLIRKQLSEFQLKRQKSGDVKYENSLDSIHDDLVIALGLTCWWFVKQFGASLTYSPGKSKIREGRVYDPLRRSAWQKDDQKSRPFR
jgi:hypothetical protein